MLEDVGAIQEGRKVIGVLHSRRGIRLQIQCQVYKVHRYLVHCKTDLLSRRYQSVQQGYRAQTLHQYAFNSVILGHLRTG